MDEFLVKTTIHVNRCDTRNISSIVQCMYISAKYKQIFSIVMQMFPTFRFNPTKRAPCPREWWASRALMLIRPRISHAAMVIGYVDEREGCIIFPINCNGASRYAVVQCGGVEYIVAERAMVRVSVCVCGADDYVARRWEQYVFWGGGY